MNENNNVMVPGYVKDALEKDNKKYGTSVLDYIPDNAKETEESDVFRKDEYDEAEIEKQRSELKEDYDGSKIKETISKDALSGIITSTPEGINEADYSETYKEINADLDKKNIQGKTLSVYGISLLTSLLGEAPSEEETKLLATKFDEYKDQVKTEEINKANFSILDTDTINSFFSERILNQLNAMCETEERYREIANRFLEQLFITYQNTISYRDDIKELNELANSIDKSGILSNNFNPENIDEKSIDYINEKIAKYMELMKNLDERNTKLRQDYKITDIETLVLEEAKASLDDAINYISIKNKVSGTAKKFRIDLKNKKNTDRSIENWIHDIKHDPKILFTFPCNDFLSDSESREELVKFFYNAYLVDIVYNKGIDIPVDVSIEDYLVDNNISTIKELDILKEKAYAMLYMISRTFKYNRVEGNVIRTLSYTLDIISKLGIKSHRDAFIEASDYVYTTLYK